MKSPLRKFEYLQETKCVNCKKKIVAKVFRAYGGTNPKHDYWVISSVYCSTKCSKIGDKKFKASW